MTAKSPPRTLKAEGRRLWLELNRAWEFDGEAMLLLKVALEAYERLSAVREQIDREGAVLKSPSGVAHAHPGLRVEKEARSGFLQAWRMLNLGMEPPREAGRPPGRWPNV